MKLSIFAVILLFFVACEENCVIKSGFDNDKQNNNTRVINQTEPEKLQRMIKTLKDRSEEHTSELQSH